MPRNHDRYMTKAQQEATRKDQHDIAPTGGIQIPGRNANPGRLGTKPLPPNRLVVSIYPKLAELLLSGGFLFGETP
jgi:hypothetical protein